MQLETLAIDDDLRLQTQQGQRGLSQVVLTDLVRSENLMVMSHWLDSSRFKGLREVPYKIGIGEEIRSAADVLTLPHRMTFLAKPVEDDNQIAKYYLAEVVWADEGVEPLTPLAEYEKTMKYGLYLLAIRNTDGEINSGLASFFETWKGYYHWVQDTYNFSESRGRDIRFQAYLAYPRGTSVMDRSRRSVRIDATAFDENQRIISVMDEECKAVADKIIALNRIGPVDYSRLLK